MKDYWYAAFLLALNILLVAYLAINYQKSNKQNEQLKEIIVDCKIERNTLLKGCDVP